ncbi:MAG: hypothetical protein ACYDEQ_07620 [Desulfocucumaceae bacterium]
MSFNEAWELFFGTRLEILGTELMKDPKYKKRFDIVHKQIDDIMEGVSPEAKEKLRQLCFSLGDMEAAAEDFWYLAGLRDGLALSQWLTIHEGPNDDNDYLSNCLGAHLNLVASIARVG